MKLSQQFAEAFYYAPISISQLKRRSSLWLFIYLSLGGIVFAIFSWLLISNQMEIKAALLDYLFPKSWHSVSEKLGDFLFESQAKTVLVNLILSGSLVMASICLFPIKEKFSAEFEKEARYQNGAINEFPLSIQALEETKLFLLYLTAQSIILWIGYYPYQWADTLSITLSYLFLFFTFGLDFISPTFQRHRQEYSKILKLLLKKPILVLSFGLIFSLPTLIFSRFILQNEQLSLIEIASLLFFANLLFLSLAVPAGTRVASRLMNDIRLLESPNKNSIRLAYSAMSLLLVCGLFLHGKLITSMHHKSQLLKADYQVDWDSFSFDFPALSKLFSANALTNLSFDLVISNPTEFDIAIEDSQILLEKAELTVATIDLAGFEIPAGQSRKIKMKLDSNSDLGKLGDLQNLLAHWRIDLQLKLFPGIPLIINIVEP